MKILFFFELKNTYTFTGTTVSAITAGCVSAETGCTPSTTTSPATLCTLVANQNAIFACYTGNLNQITTTTASTWAAAVCIPSARSFCKVSL